MCQAYSLIGLPPLVRIPSHDPNAATMVLDGGAAGIIAPYVETAEQVQALCGAVKMRPIKGQKLQRMIEGGSIEPGLKTYIDEAAKNRLLIVNIESTPAMDCARRNSRRAWIGWRPNRSARPLMQSWLTRTIRSSRLLGRLRDHFEKGPCGTTSRRDSFLGQHRATGTLPQDGCQPAHPQRRHFAFPEAHQERIVRYPPIRRAFQCFGQYDYRSRQKRSISRYVKDADQVMSIRPSKASMAAMKRIGPLGNTSPYPTVV